MDAKFYTEILETHLPEVRNMLRGNWRLQQDNDPKHTSRIVKEFLDKNVPEVMNWLSNTVRSYSILQINSRIFRCISRNLIGLNAENFITKWALIYQKGGYRYGYTKWFFCIGVFSAVSSTHLGSFYLNCASKTFLYNSLKLSNTKVVNPPQIFASKFLDDRHHVITAFLIDQGPIMYTAVRFFLWGEKLVGRRYTGI